MGEILNWLSQASGKIRGVTFLRDIELFPMGSLTTVRTSSLLSSHSSVLSDVTCLLALITSIDTRISTHSLLIFSFNRDDPFLDNLL